MQARDMIMVGRLTCGIARTADQIWPKTRSESMETPSSESSWPGGNRDSDPDLDQVGPQPGQRVYPRPPA